jgi:hypothetical protein
MPFPDTAPIAHPHFAIGTTKSVLIAISKNREKLNKKLDKKFQIEKIRKKNQ